MSLSFVSKAVQTATEEGGFEETPIVGKDGVEGRSSSAGNAKPLFEQLRANQEQEEAEQEEQRRAILRGTVELNEEDSAHLDAVDRQKQEKEAERHRATQEALAAFRAAQADKQDIINGARASKPGFGSEEIDAPSNDKEMRPLVVIRRKRRRDEVSHSNHTERITSQTEKKTTSGDLQEIPPANADGQSKSLGGLLNGYGTSDEE